MGRAIYGAFAPLCFCWLIASASQAQTPAADATREEMQRALNAEVLASPFNPGDIDKAKRFADEALKKGTPPVQQVPSYWQRGWDCGSLTRYQRYYYNDYRNCIYYHRYYGYYW